MAKYLLQAGVSIAQAGVHGYVQGILSLAQGGTFEQAFIAGALGSLGAAAFSMSASSYSESAVGTILFGATSGGIGSSLSGGNFWEGVVIGGMVAAFNHVVHSMNNKSYSVAELQRKGFIEEQIKSIYDNYLKPGDVSVDQLIEKIGGPLEQEYNKKSTLYNDLQGNTCALRLSYAMNHAGFAVNGDWIGGGGLRYYTAATRMTNNYLNNFGGQYTYGKPYNQSDVTTTGIIAQYRNANSVLHVDIAYKGNYGTNHYQNWKTVNWLPVK